MNVTAIPFNRFLGLRADGGVLTLPADPNYQNHLGTMHAGAQFALAEAASGQWLLSRFGAEAASNLAVVRHADVKFRRPAADSDAASSKRTRTPPGQSIPQPAADWCAPWRRGPAATAHPGSAPPRPGQ